MLRSLLTLTCAVLTLGLALPVHAKGGSGRRPRTEIAGTITAITADPPTITVLVAGQPVTLGITPATEFEVNDLPGRFEDLSVGLLAEAEIDPATMTAIEIGVETIVLAEVMGTVEGVDAATGQVTLRVTNLDGTTTDLALTLGPAAELGIGAATLSPQELDLFLGATVEVEYDVATLEIAGMDWVAPDALSLSAAVTAVDVAGRTLTVGVGPASFGMVVPSGAQIRAGSTPVGLDAVRPGDNARITYVMNGLGVLIAARMEVSAGTRQQVTGDLIAVDPAAQSVTVGTGATAVTLVVSPTTDLRINGKRATLAGLAAALAAAKPGAPVKVSAQFLARSGVHTATQIHATVTAAGGGSGGKGGSGKGGSGKGGSGGGKGRGRGGR